MPGRTRQAPAATEEATPHQTSDKSSELQFSAALTWRAGKAIPVADLLERLQNLAGELKSLQQQDFDQTTFVKVAQDLASPNLLGHKDKGIRAFTLCCVVDILRLCAPNAPFKNAQLKV
jgi:sister chromatid cohesion protein PDS5